MRPVGLARERLPRPWATIEADVEQVKLTRFEVSRPEMRHLSLEGWERCNQRIRTFYSGSLADIILGGKELGTQGRWTTSFLATRTDPLEDQRQTLFLKATEVFQKPFAPRRPGTIATRGPSS